MVKYFISFYSLTPCRAATNVVGRPRPTTADRRDRPNISFRPDFSVAVRISSSWQFCCFAKRISLDAGEVSRASFGTPWEFSHMPRRARLVLLFGLACGGASIAGQARAAGPEFNPVRMHPVAIGPETHRLIVGFRATPDNAVTKTVMFRTRGRRYSITQAQTSGADVTALAQRAGLNLTRSRQFTPSMHVLFLQKTLYGADVLTVLGKLRADPALQFADVDALRY